MKVIVVGASSFTGKHFCTYAREKGAEVVEANLRHFPWIPEADGNYVVNFAAVNVVAPSWSRPGHYMKVNVGRVTEMADLLRNFMPKKYVHVSTPEVYGSTNGWITEDAPYNPSTPYAVSRAAAEMLLKCYHKQYGLPVVFTRACNVYGPGQQLYRLIPKLIVSIKKGIKFPLEGGGLSSRSFVHVRDVCDATWRVMVDGEPGTAYHISRPQDIQIIQIVSTIFEKMGVSSAGMIDFVSERPGKDAEYKLLCDRIHALGWQAKIWLNEGIDEVVAWIDKNWDTLKHQPMEYIP